MSNKERLNLLTDAEDDVNFIIKKHYSSEENKKELTGTLWKDNYREQKEDILNLYGYREWSDSLKKITIDQLEKLIRMHPKGNDTLRELYIFLENEKIIFPSYRTTACKYIQNIVYLLYG